MMADKIKTFIMRTAKPKRYRKDYETTSGRMEDKRFYCSKQWLKTRAIILANDPICRACEAEGIVTPAEHIDHIIPRKIRPDLAFDADNLQPLCRSCHGRKTLAEQSTQHDSVHL